MSVAENGLNEGESRDRRGVGAQDARTERQSDDPGDREERRPLGVRKATLRADQHSDPRFRLATGGREGRDGIGLFGLLVAEDECAITRPVGQLAVEPQRALGGWHSQHAALLDRLDDIGAHPLHIEPGRLRVLG